MGMMCIITNLGCFFMRIASNSKKAKKTQPDR